VSTGWFRDIDDSACFANLRSTNDHLLDGAVGVRENLAITVFAHVESSGIGSFVVAKGQGVVGRELGEDTTRIVVPNELHEQVAGFPFCELGGGGYWGHFGVYIRCCWYVGLLMGEIPSCK
jgi:hypothetical protein